ncbi:MAG: hypothetical protein C0391_05620 [Anaerolinea sp.]|nr:hypothetical protein [Anaerolinea sp.]
MSLYRIYIDETGNHDMNHADDPNQQFLALTGVIIESKYNISIFQPELDAIKMSFFMQDPDLPVILHRKEIVNRRRPFEALRDPQIEDNFNQTILSGLKRWQYRVITVVIDKKIHRDQYSVWRYHPYHYCLAVMLERYVLFLHYGDNHGDVMVESRGRAEDEKLKDSFQRLYKLGTDNVPSERWQDRLTSCELKVKSKTTDIAGLQLADIIAHPSRREILLDNKLIIDQRDTFGDKICRILRDGKYLRFRHGKIEGYGKKLLP